MATSRQIEANRRNALKSTGPQTPEGKAAVRLNSLRHGLRARTVVLPGEDPQEFQQLCDDLEAEWQPLTRTEQCYVEQMAVAQWKLARLETSEGEIHAKGLNAFMSIPLLDRIWQAQLRLERSFARAQHELERIQISRNHQAQEPASAAKIAPAPQPVTAVVVPAAPNFTPTPATPPPQPQSGVPV